MLNRLFLDHPRSVGETYWTHQQMAFRFSAALILAGAACFIHGLVPALFQRTGSQSVARLNDRMVAHRRQVGEAPMGGATVPR